MSTFSFITLQAVADAKGMELVRTGNKQYPYDLEFDKIGTAAECETLEEVYNTILEFDEIYKERIV